MSESLTDWLQTNRLVVVAVDPSTRHIRLKSAADVCTDVTCAEVMVTDDNDTHGLESLNAGDIVRLDGGTPARPDRIVVVRRVWEELTSPEF
jgi:hypothetical protein